MSDWTHLDANGRPCMVDVTAKGLSRRVAIAAGSIRLQAPTIQAIADNTVPKGNVLLVAQIAGIQAAKQTHTLIPLCHPLPITKVDVETSTDASLGRVDVKATVSCTSRTGVEMEALTAVTVALLTIYDMCKAVDKTMEISEVKLLKKTKTALESGGANE